MGGFINSISSFSNFLSNQWLENLDIEFSNSIIWKWLRWWSSNLESVLFKMSLYSVEVHNCSTLKISIFSTPFHLLTLPLNWSPINLTTISKGVTFFFATRGEPAWLGLFSVRPVRDMAGLSSQLGLSSVISLQLYDVINYIRSLYKPLQLRDI